MPENEMTSAFLEECKFREEFSNGGPWLGAARTWMQSHIKNGDTMPWSSTEEITIPFFVLEDLAREVAIAAVREERRKNKEKK